MICIRLPATQFHKGNRFIGFATYQTDANLRNSTMIGIVGAVLSGYFVPPFLGGAPITTGSFDMKSLVVSLLSALILLAIINLIRRGNVR